MKKDIVPTSPGAIHDDQEKPAEPTNADARDQLAPAPQEALDDLDDGSVSMADAARAELPELAAIHEMLERARPYGLEAEAINAFAEFYKGGDTVEKACACAIYEWDL